MTFAEFPSYFRLMLLAARWPLREGERAGIAEIISSGVEWEDFLAVATAHRLVPLVSHGLQGLEGVPPGVQERLERRTSANRARVLRISLETQRIVRHLGKGGFPLTLLKGAALSQAAYRDVSVRHAGDLDLLTASGDLQAQVELLRELGYELVNPPGPLPAWQMRVFPKYWKDFTFRNEKVGLEVDFHWRLFNNRRQRANRLMAGGEYASTEVFGMATPTLSERAQFVYGALHGVSDGWVYLKGLADVAAFLRRFTAEELDSALALAAEKKLLPQVSSAVHLAAELMGARAESRLLLGVDDRFHRALRSSVVSRLQREHFRPRRDRPGATEGVAYELRLAPGVRSAMQIAGRYLWRPRIWSMVRLPEPMFWLYPVLALLVPPRLSPTGTGSARAERETGPVG